MGMFRLDIKKNILMKRKGSHVGDVLIKMSEWPGHCCRLPSSAPAWLQSLAASGGGLGAGLPPGSLPLQKTSEVAHIDDAMSSQLYP